MTPNSVCQSHLAVSRLRLLLLREREYHRTDITGRLSRIQADVAVAQSWVQCIHYEDQGLRSNSKELREPVSLRPAIYKSISKTAFSSSIGPQPIRWPRLAEKRSTLYTLLLVTAQ